MKKPPTLILPLAFIAMCLWFVVGNAMIIATEGPQLGRLFLLGVWCVAGASWTSILKYRFDQYDKYMKGKDDERRGGPSE